MSQKLDKCKKWSQIHGTPEIIQKFDKIAKQGQMLQIMSNISQNTKIAKSGHKLIDTIRQILSEKLVKIAKSGQCVKYCRTSVKIIPRKSVKNWIK